MKNKKRILSGVQPTGDLHIGNWLGAINNWVTLQEQYETFLCVVDLHAITATYNPKELSKNTISTAALYVACGIDPKICSIFVQSQISAHSELCWILNCMTPINWMERMIQFKEKSIQQGNNVSIGLFDYPILMAADILLYDADFVPVGEDQKQHLELSRDIAQKFNLDFNVPNFLRVPEPLIQKNFSRIMSLKDGTKKMSKSDPSDLSRINLTDSKDEIKNKIKKAKTDKDPLPIDDTNLNQRPEVENLLGIYSSLNNQSLKNSIDDFRGKNFSDFKEQLADLVVEKISPISMEIQKLQKENNYLDSILKEGGEKANKIASKKVEEIKKIIGF